jgi:hypothetical protein
MAVRIDADYTWRGFRAVVLENAHVRAMFLPELGGKLWSLIDKSADSEVLWHNPRMGPRLASYGAAYDDWFCGGWDELFPNDAPTALTGDPYPDHGEWWSMPFEWSTESSDELSALVLRRRGVVTDTLVEKRIELHADAAALHIHYRLVNHSYQPLDYLWKLHPALAITPQHRIDMPAHRVVVDEGFRGRLGATVDTFQWPFADSDHGRVDMRQVPPVTARACDFYYALDLPQGWCALTDTAQRRGFGLAFDPDVFRSVWVFGAYGGWRNLYVAILEPCTGYPYLLDTAVAQGTASRLEPGAELRTSLTAVLYRGMTGVAGITIDGAVQAMPADAE